MERVALCNFNGDLRGLNLVLKALL
ncbi:hypothetical protein D041_0572A, partial [Vibrio parahaemolyticus EKP-008]